MNPDDMLVTLEGANADGVEVEVLSDNRVEPAAEVLPVLNNEEEDAGSGSDRDTDYDESDEEEDDESEDEDEVEELAATEEYY